MIKPHGHRGEEGMTATLQPQDAEEIQPVPEGPDGVLQQHHREHTDGLHHSLVRQLHHCRLQDATEGATLSRTHHCVHTAPALQDTYNTRCRRKVKKIIKDPSHPSHGLFSLNSHH
ncbi:hypothetical protein J4Q44_G00153440 [Coregonus suidteri]|uniref:Uncharacterized protein n=1 Tax=Coregonus suidteri TaxID=861788 RepID=A0AAN8LWY4_9TELE